MKRALDNFKAVLDLKVNQGALSDAQQADRWRDRPRGAGDLPAGLSRCVRAHAEDAYQLFQVHRLLVEGGRRGNRLLHQRGVLLGGGINQANRAVNLRDPSVCSWLARRISRRITSISSTLPTMPLISSLAFSTSSSRPASGWWSFQSAHGSHWLTKHSSARAGALHQPPPQSHDRARPPAASTAAFSARILVWKAMASIRSIMSDIRFEVSLIRRILLVTCFIISPLF